MPHQNKPPSRHKSTRRGAKHLKKSQEITRKNSTPPEPSKDPIPNRRRNLTSHKEVRDRLDV